MMHFFRGRMRSATRLQVVGAVLGGFLIGYLLLPLILPSPATDTSYSRNSRKIDLEHRPPGRVPPVDKVPGDRAIHFTKDGSRFIVAGREKLIMSGSIHYFRVVPAYWRDRLSKLRAAGLNTVTTYVAWNLHEPVPGHFDFTGILDIKEFISTAHRLGLHVIVRPGPYICAEWEMGGLPAWLLHDPNMELRSTYPRYQEAVEKYFRELFKILVPLQWSHGGPIVAFQVENEFAEHPIATLSASRDHMHFLHSLMLEVGVKELLLTSDGQNSLNVSLSLRPADNVLLTVNLMMEKTGLADLKSIQPDKPLMVTEFWTGWFDHWQQPRTLRGQSDEEIATRTTDFIKRGVSFNYYMFHGGTNFGFMNGANWGWGLMPSYIPTITSYDYKAPISECGDITPMYKAVRRVLTQHAVHSLPVNPLPPIPENLPKMEYGDVKLTLYIPLLNTLQYIPDPQSASNPVPMEELSLPVNDGWGQSYGYVLYRTLIPASAHQVTVHGLKDFGVAMVDYQPIKTLSFFNQESFFLPKTEDKGTGQVVLDILVENAGRVNFGSPLDTRKGINGEVEVDGRVQENWKIYPFQFKSSFVENIESGGMWQRTPAPSSAGPSLFKGTFNIQGKPCDTFADMQGWGKGILIINGANLGRYWSGGPQRTLYVPAPILRQGVNKVMIFELHHSRTPAALTFIDRPILDDSAKTE